MAEVKTSRRYAGKMMIHDVKVTDIMEKASIKSFTIADTIHSAIEYMLLERIENRIGNSRCYEDNSYLEGVMDALWVAGIITKEQKQEINNIKKSWWERISANIEKEEN